MYFQQLVVNLQHCATINMIQGYNIPSTLKGPPVPLCTPVLTHSLIYLEPQHSASYPLPGRKEGSPICNPSTRFPLSFLGPVEAQGQLRCAARHGLLR